MRKREKLVKQMMEYLCGRGGFDDWWRNLDDDIQEEIIVDLAEFIRVKTTTNK